MSSKQNSDHTLFLA